ncbi:PepSY domain-containing protein [Liquorilactobacillus uvarum]|uniref:PepSY domain-containing protein n=1 Tax=Liquorilactobacillus uvarum TaxID=303240 RepID=UPI0028896D3A|nr:PepSY domain-containing protein [Liquorilactobacillus uvarum]
MKKLHVLILGVSSLGLLAGCSSNNQDAASSSSSSEITSSKTNQKSVLDDKVKVSANQVIEIYQKAYPDTDITSIELDSTFGKYYYEVEGVDDNNEYSLRVDASSKTVSQKKQEQLDNDEKNGTKRNEDKLNLDKLISVEEAADIAEKAAGSGSASEWTLDKDMDTTYWEVQVKNGSKQVEVKVNAQTGKVLEKETDD